MDEEIEHTVMPEDYRDRKALFGWGRGSKGRVGRREVGAPRLVWLGRERKVVLGELSVEARPGRAAGPSLGSTHMAVVHTDQPPLPTLATLGFLSTHQTTTETAVICWQSEQPSVQFAAAIFEGVTFAKKKLRERVQIQDELARKVQPVREFCDSGSTGRASVPIRQWVRKTSIPALNVSPVNNLLGLENAGSQFEGGPSDEEQRETEREEEGEEKINKEKREMEREVDEAEKIEDEKMEGEREEEEDEAEKIEEEKREMERAIQKRTTK
ncbi:hypothetical protein DM860_013994 [Cuscuta australis]|uniref:Uncharacterized protein n=1 Tax=Cuscuta australis TaxID=267555 RepID=A0A328DPC3_9ASTE|nr:hypothetical protein DM860_013994 [Cuscuta australis]